MEYQIGSRVRFGSPGAWVTGTVSGFGLMQPRPDVQRHLVTKVIVTLDPEHCGPLACGTYVTVLLVDPSNLRLLPVSGGEPLPVEP